MRPSPLVRSLHLALTLFGISVGILGSAILLVFASSNPDDRWAIVLYTVVFCVYLLAGITAWWRRPGNRIGAIIVVGGVAVLGAGLGNASEPLLIALGSVCATLVLAVLVHLLHAFPSGRLRGTASTTIVVVAYVNSTIVQAPSYLFVQDPGNLLFLADLPWIVAAADIAQRIAGVLIPLATVVVLLRRLREADAAHRRVLVPLFAYGLFAVLFIPFSAGVLEDMLGVSAWMRGVLQLAVLGGAPIAFTVSMLRGGFARTAELGDLDSWIGAGGGERSTLVTALARTIGDPGLTIAYWVHDRDIYVDADGVLVSLPPAGDRRAAIDVEIDGRRVGAVIYDTGLIADAGHVRDSARLAAIALDRQRLTAELHVSERALAEARARIEQADAGAPISGSGIARLTPRQCEVLGLIAQGRSNVAIARELMLTEKSVANHMSRIYDALELPVEADDHRRVRATIRFLAG